MENLHFASYHVMTYNPIGPEKPETGDPLFSPGVRARPDQW